MKPLNYLFRIFPLLVFLNIIPTLIFARTDVTGLVCEYHSNPLGIDILHPRLSWQIKSEGSGIHQTAYEIRAAGSVAALRGRTRELWTSGKVNSDQSVDVVYGGPGLKSMERVYWQVRIWDNKGKVTAWSAPGWWEMGILNPGLWTASWIGEPSVMGKSGPRACPYFRKDFVLQKTVQSARVYVTCLGLYQLFLNGQKVSTDLFTPGWTSYNKRLQYQTYDVTSLLKPDNTIGAIVGDGWYRGNIAWNGNDYYGDHAGLLCELRITYSDGTVRTVNTDQSWKVTTGPILSSDIYNGETIDSRLSMPGWSSPGFDDSQWHPVSELDHTKVTLIAPQGDKVKVCDEIKPEKLITTPKGEVVFDLGQNMVGWVKLHVKGERGDTITLKFAEVLDKAGNFYTANLRKAKATDRFILSGSGEETFEPHFTFHGFRYVELTGYRGKPSLAMLTGEVIHSAMKPTGTFSCSNPLINQLQHNIQWGQKGNFLDVPTDCPQRDERLGWTGDAQVFSSTAAYNFNVASFYTKWLGDVSADQLPSGLVPHVIPDVLRGEGGSTAWADASVIVPWTTYLAYGDRRILQVQYSSMKAWVDYMKHRAGSDFLWTGDNHFGDWLAYATNRSDYPGATTDKDLIANAYFSYSSGLLSQVAKILGKTNDAHYYGQLSRNVKEAFNKEYVTPNGRLVSNTQTAYSLALEFNLLPQALISPAASYLAADVKKFGHLTTGFVGTPLLCKALSDHGYPQLAFMLLNRKEYPSWLYPVTQGATTIWERWDGQKPDGSFQDPGMNSFNHYAYGAIGEWLYQYVGGLQIDPGHPGYKHFILSPHMGGGLTNAKATFESMYGSIQSEWKVEGTDFVYSIAIPANTSATVILPNAKEEQLTLNSKPIGAGMRESIQQVAANVSLELGSGHYRFRYPIEK